MEVLKMKKTSLLIASLLLVTMAAGCAVPLGSGVAEKQNYVRSMRDETLAQLYSFNPDLKSKVEDAAAVAVFSNVNIHLLFLSTARGYGIAVDKATGKETYMRMTRIGAGIGAGLKDFRAVFLFHDPATFETFVNQGWEFGTDGEAALIAGGRTGLALGLGVTGQSSGFGAGAGAQAGIGAASGGGHASGGYGMSIYEITKNGVVLQAEIAGTKYSKDTELN
jgi:lipid-binding SYLF domain-containing protein